MDLLEKIAVETGGKVMPNDFLPFRCSEIETPQASEFVAEAKAGVTR